MGLQAFSSNHPDPTQQQSSLNPNSSHLPPMNPLDRVRLQQVSTSLNKERQLTSPRQTSTTGTLGSEIQNPRSKTLPYLSNQSSMSQMGMASNDPRTYLAYMLDAGPTALSEPHQFEVTDPPFQQLQTTSTIQNTQSNQSQTDVTPNSLNPRPYLTYTPVPGTPGLLDHHQLGITDVPFQQLHTASTIPNVQSNQSQMDVTPNSLNPRPYLTYTPASPPSGLSTHQQQQSEITESSNAPFDLNRVDMTFDYLNPRPYLTYVPVAQSAGQDEQHPYLIPDQQIGNSHLRQVELIRHPNEAQPNSGVQEWDNQSRDQTDYITLRNNLDDSYRFGTYPSACQLVSTAA